MSAEPSHIQQVAQRLRQAYETGVPIGPIRDQLPAGDLGAAYAAQKANTDYWLARGRRLVGRKIGLTAKSVQEQLGVDQPDYGMLFADMAVCDGEEVSLARVMQPKVEGEVALVLDRELALEHPTAADLISATAYALPAIEIVGSRIENWDIKLTDTIADNASAGLFVLGTRPVALADLDLVQCAMTMERDGEQVSSGNGAACMGNPLTAALWLARTMAAIGAPLKAGDIIMTGALGPMAPAAAGDRFAAHLSGLGSVRVNFTT